MATLKKNIERKRSLKKRSEKQLTRNATTQSAFSDTVQNVTVRAGKGANGLNKTIEHVKNLRESKKTPNSTMSPTIVYHKYGKNSVRSHKVTN